MCPFLVTYRSQAPLAQLVEQLTLNQLVEGSSPSWCTICTSLRCASNENIFDSVAQLVEQWPFKPLVLRSSRSGVTTFLLAPKSRGRITLRSLFLHSWGIKPPLVKGVFSYLIVNSHSQSNPNKAKYTAIVGTLFVGTLWGSRDSDSQISSQRVAV